jgi:hypothetical protein
MELLSNILDTGCIHLVRHLASWNGIGLHFEDIGRIMKLSHSHSSREYPEDEA